MRAHHDDRRAALPRDAEQRVRHVDLVGHDLRLRNQPERASELSSVAGHSRGVLTLGAIDRLDGRQIRGQVTHTDGVRQAHRYRRKPWLPDRHEHSRTPGEELGGVPNGGPGNLRTVVADQDRCRGVRHAPRAYRDRRRKREPDPSWAGPFAARAAARCAFCSATLTFASA